VSPAASASAAAATQGAIAAADEEISAAAARRGHRGVGLGPKGIPWALLEELEVERTRFSGPGSGGAAGSHGVPQGGYHL
jgi:hypothetical protein